MRLGGLEVWRAARRSPGAWCRCSCCCSLNDRNGLTGIVLGAALLTRTVAGFCAVPLLLAPLVTRRIRPLVMTAMTAVITVCIGLAPFIIAAQVATLLLRKPILAQTCAGLIGLLPVASCCLPLFAKTVFAYYLAEPYVLATIWWLARPGGALNWRGLVPLLLSIDVFIIKVALISPFSTWGSIEGVTSSAVIAVAVGLVTYDLLHASANVSAANSIDDQALRQATPAIQEAQ